MLRRHVLLLRFAVLASEALIAYLAVAVAASTGLGAGLAGGDRGLAIPWPVAGMAYGLAWGAAIWLSDLHRLRARWTVRSEVIDVLRTFAMVQLVLFAGLFLVRQVDISRILLLELLAIHLTLALFLRIALRVVAVWLPERARGVRWVLVAGAGPDALSFASQITRHPELGLRTAGHLAGTGEPPPGTAPHVLGRLADAVRVLQDAVVDEVFIAVGPADAAYVEPLVQLAHQQGKIARIRVGDAPALAIPGGRLESLDGVRVLSVLPTNERTIGLAVKRVVDLVGACLGLVALSPLLAVIALAILATDGRPVLFRQTRIGLHGRPFEVVKFRTMVRDAEDRLSGLAAHNEVQGHAFKLSDDPRITRIGRLLRRTSLDELPQLWNVVRGEMSIVGPRPPLPGEVEQYDLWHRRRLSMKPGITGLWQVSARHDPEFDRWVELDLRYIDRWSLWLDVKIMARTLPAMLTGR